MLHHPLLRPVFVTQFIFNTASFLLLAVFVPYAVRHLRLAASGVGTTLAMYGVGMIAGALAATRIMRVLPFKHVYDSATGRRIYFIYGDVFDTTRIDERTMEESVPSFFGNGNMTFFEHMSLMIRKGRAVDATGADAYLANTDRYKLPITFMTGLHNRMFVPRGLRESYELMSAANGRDGYRHIVMSEYAHLDLWLGENSANDVFPVVLAELERQES